MSAENTINDVQAQENALPPGDRMNAVGTNMESLTRVELDLAFASEKLLNLEMLVMEIARRATDFEPLTLDSESVSSETAENAFELDTLYGILDAEVQELDDMISSLQIDAKNVEHKAYDEESGGKVKAKLDAAMSSLKQMQDLIADIRKESAKFEKAIEFSSDQAGITEDGVCENGHMPSGTSMHTEDQQRNILQMLEQSIASEIDLEKKLSDSRYAVEELQMKLHLQKQETYFLEELAETNSGRLFEAENASEILLGTSRELINGLNSMQVQLSASSSRENDLTSKLERSLKELSSLKLNQEKMQEESKKVETEEAVQNEAQSTPELLSLQHQVEELEKHFRESNSQLLLEKVSAEVSQEKENLTLTELSTLESVIKNLKADVLRAENRAQNAEVRCMQLTKDNVELSRELSSLKSQGSDKARLLERELMESNGQLEHAKASVAAFAEQQGMLKSTVSDMEHMIEDLKGKVSKSETRALKAESKCTLLTDTNLELSEELSFLRGRVESLESSLHEANHVKVSTIKDIGLRTKVITELVTKLAMERERLHLQISMLTKKNKILAHKSKGSSVKDGTKLYENATGKDAELQFTTLAEEIVSDSSSAQNVAEKAADLTDGRVGAEESTGDEEDSADEGVLRTIKPSSALSWKYVATALLAVVAAVVVCHLLLEGGA
ncbi:WPP domain-interacting tail-anchored protein 1-like [Hordeum vulgare subsp. vulgare]|uniref:WIT1/2 N-terminal helical bundle domain-containing protein n=1 Tax=Hordeum vulgare subsp. vulgare TaxID=112509 RepID=A0A8I6YGB8_HORVV|nr:WPP domain-interacting tail-anchored protein 1-like [Hordeum vulgare subsp. vulgare]